MKIPPAPIVGRRTNLIGHNIRPGMIPGGFAIGTRFDDDFTHTASPLPRKDGESKIINEAANRVLENRQFVRNDPPPEIANVTLPPTP
jgi:hypothetical protein